MLENLRKYSVFKYFEEISKIPRKSGNEQEIVKYLENFARKRNLKYIAHTERRTRKIRIIKTRWIGLGRKYPMEHWF